MERQLLRLLNRFWRNGVEIVFYGAVGPFCAIKSRFKLWRNFMSDFPSSPLPCPNPPLNAVHDFVTRLFPDNSGSWSVSEMMRVVEPLYCHPDDVKINRDGFYDAIDRLTRRKEEFPSADAIECIPARGGYRYPPRSCRLIVREMIRGRLPKDFRQKSHDSPPIAPDAAPTAIE